MTGRRNPFIRQEQRALSRVAVDPEVAVQRAESLGRDRTARLALLAAMLCKPLASLAAAPDPQFRALLPAFFPGLQANPSLTQTATAAAHLCGKQILTDFMKQFHNSKYPIRVSCFDRSSCV